MCWHAVGVTQRVLRRVRSDGVESGEWGRMERHDGCSLRRDFSLLLYSPLPHFWAGHDRGKALRPCRRCRRQSRAGAVLTANSAWAVNCRSRSAARSNFPQPVTETCLSLSWRIRSATAASSPWKTSRRAMASWISSAATDCTLGIRPEVDLATLISRKEKLAQEFQRFHPGTSSPASIAL